VARFFTDMVKFVADIERGVVAPGGELHADAEAVQDPADRARVRDLAFRLIGRGESLP